jgi:SAM-dependent methyltransferase
MRMGATVSCPALGPGTRHAQDWEELAAVDPCWAILPAPGTRDGGWELEEFFRTGRGDVESLMARAEGLGPPAGRARALDVGCGVGRHARWLAAEFDDYLGIDVSPTMIERATRFHEGVAGVRFAVGDATRLNGLEADSFDLVQCWLVLIHLGSRDEILSAIGALVRVLRPGGLLTFQVVSHIAPRNRVQGRRRLYRGLRRIGVRPRSLQARLRLNPVRMTAIAPADAEGRLDALGARVLSSEQGSFRDGLDTRLYFVTK